MSATSPCIHQRIGCEICSKPSTLVIRDKDLVSRTTLLSQLQEGVKGLLAYREVAGYGVQQDDNGRIISKDEVLALIKKAGE